MQIWDACVLWENLCMDEETDVKNVHFYSFNPSLSKASLSKLLSTCTFMKSTARQLGILFLTCTAALVEQSCRTQSWPQTLFVPQGMQ